VLASVARGETRIAGLPMGGDVRAALGVLRSVGVEVRELAPAAVAVRGSPPGPHRGWRGAAPLELGESATLARFSLAVAGLCGRCEDGFELRASGTLVRRRSDALLAALREAGVQIEHEPWPVRLAPIGPPPTVHLRAPRSSQEASALAIALCAWPDESELVVHGELPSEPYFRMTLRELERFGARAEQVSSAPATWRLRGPLSAPDTPLEIEPDASLSAVALAAACLGGGEVLALGVRSDSTQGDTRIAEFLRAFGCRASFHRTGLVASGFPQRAVTLDLRGEPDLAPVLAAIAAGAALVDSQGTSVLRGLDTLPGKESSRIETLAHGLSAAGWKIEHDERSLSIARGEYVAGLDVPPPVTLDPRGDHRMAFAFALLGLIRPGVFVREPDCAAKSWPSFWKDLAALGAKVVEA
jgi:3-phosphoshikimate 1-carboxyvinyltransferase